MDVRELKDRATQLFGKGKFAKAAETYEEYCAADRKDHQARLRCGDAWSKAGKKDKAIAAYAYAAEGFAKDGFLPRAIACSKLVLEIDPAHKGVQKMLAELYALKSGAGRGSPKASPSTSAAPLESASTPVAEAIEIEVESPTGLVASSAVDTEIQLESPAGAVVAEADFEVKVEGLGVPPPPPPADDVEVAPAPAPTSPMAEIEPASVQASPSAVEAGGHPAAPNGGASPPGLKPKRQDVQPHPSRGDPRSAPTFTELDLDGDSLLQSLEVLVPAPKVAGDEPMEPPDERLEVRSLPKIPLFSDLPSDAFIELFEQCPLLRFAQGQLVFEQGDEADALYVICGGRARVFHLDEGRRTDLAVIEEGSFFGEMALLSEAPRSASVEAAVEDTQVLAIAGETLAQLSSKYPSVSSALKKFCRQRMLSNVMNTARLFAPFNRSDRRELVQQFRSREVQKGEVLIKQGQPSDGLYVVLSGELEVDASGTIIASLRVGQVFGEMSLLTRSPATATVRASRQTSVLRLPKPEFDRLILSHPQVLEHVASLADERAKADERRSEML
jgi:CRP-like cAMP-binding protein